MTQENHQERQKELEQVFQQQSANDIKDTEKVKTQAELVEMSGMLFDFDQANPTPSIPLPQQPFQQQNMMGYAMPTELAQAQDAVQQAQLNLLQQNQQLQQALYQLHQAQDNVKQIQMKVQQAQLQLQMSQTTANTILNSYGK